MKILMLNHEFVPVGGGAAPVTFELCTQLAKMGHKVDVVTMRYDKLPRYEIVKGFNVYRTRAIRRRPNICYTHEMATYFPGAIFKTLSLAKHKKYDVIHCHFIIPGAPLAWTVSRLKKIPFLVTCHGSDVPDYNPDRFQLAHKVLLPAWRFLARRSGMLVSPSVWLKELIEKKCPGVDVKVIPNGIYPEHYAGGKKDKKILLCSRLLPRKGFQYAIEAVRELELDWEVHVVGEGPYRGELERLGEGSKTKIKFRGWLDKKDERFKELFKTCSIFVFPSEAENFPAVLLEAMSAGMAIITSTKGGCPEVVGDAAMLVEPGDVEGIRAGIVKLVESSRVRQEMMRSAAQRAKQFSWERIAEQYLDCYRKLMR